MAARWILLLMLCTLAATVPAADFTYAITNSTVTLTKYTGRGGSVVIPSEINGLPLTSLGNQAFANCTSLTTVVIPNSVTIFECLTFAKCTSLRSITIPKRVTRIGWSAFAGCSNLTRIRIPDSVTFIGFEAFFDCRRLTSVTIPASVTKLGEFALYNSVDLRGVYFKGNAPEVHKTVFSSSPFVTVHYLPEANGWGPTFGGHPTAVWKP
jgi:hypothetical protein